MMIMIFHHFADNYHHFASLMTLVGAAAAAAVLVRTDDNLVASAGAFDAECKKTKYSQDRNPKVEQVVIERSEEWMMKTSQREEQ